MPSFGIVMIPFPERERDDVIFEHHDMMSVPFRPSNEQEVLAKIWIIHRV